MLHTTARARRKSSHSPSFPSRLSPPLSLPLSHSLTDRSPRVSPCTVRRRRHAVCADAPKPPRNGSDPTVTESRRRRRVAARASPPRSRAARPGEPHRAPLVTAHGGHHHLRLSTLERVHARHFHELDAARQSLRGGVGESAESDTPAQRTAIARRYPAEPSPSLITRRRASSPCASPRYERRERDGGVFPAPRGWSRPASRRRPLEISPQPLRASRLPCACRVAGVASTWRTWSSRREDRGAFRDATASAAASAPDTSRETPTGDGRVHRYCVDRTHPSTPAVSNATGAQPWEPSFAASAVRAARDAP